VVRRFLLEVQQALGREKAVVFEGRDMGTVVFPGADLKFFLSASEETRAQRRFAELKEQGAARLEEVLQELRRRDAQDSTRELAPLKPAPDARVIDTTAMSIPEVVDTVISFLRSVLSTRDETR
jgi:cytidylate kinase